MRLWISVGKLFTDVTLINLQGDIDENNQVTLFLIINTKITNNSHYAKYITVYVKYLINLY